MKICWVCTIDVGLVTINQKRKVTIKYIGCVLSTYGRTIHLSLVLIRVKTSHNGLMPVLFKNPTSHVPLARPWCAKLVDMTKHLHFCYSYAMTSKWRYRMSLHSQGLTRDTGYVESYILPTIILYAESLINQEVCGIIMVMRTTTNFCTLETLWTMIQKSYRPQGLMRWTWQYTLHCIDLPWLLLTGTCPQHLLKHNVHKIHLKL